MNTIRKSIIAGLTVLGMAGTTFAVQAQVAPAAAPAAVAAAGHQHGEHKGERHAHRAERRAAHVKKLHDALKLTPAQETAWASYTAAMKPAEGAERGQRGERGAWKTMTAPERMEKRIAMAREHVTRMEARLAATTTFYGALTPEQKKLFDANTMHRGGHRGHHMKRGMMS